MAELFSQADVVIRMKVREKVMCDSLYFPKLKAVDAEGCTLHYFIGRTRLWFSLFAYSSFFRVFAQGLSFVIAAGDDR